MPQKEPEAAPARRVGVIDIGSNSIKLLVAERDEPQGLRILRFSVEDTRIGEGLCGQPPGIDEASMDRAAASVAKLASQAREAGTEKLAVVATSAAREAANRDAFAARIGDAAGVPLRILDGEEEARYIGQGVLLDPELPALDDFALLDLGGGSLEAIGFVGRKLRFARSLPLGCVRLSSRFVADRKQPLPEAERAAIYRHVQAALGEAGVERGSPAAASAILTGGAASVVKDALPAQPATPAQLIAYRKAVAGADTAARVAFHGVPASRADILTCALVTLEAAVDWLGIEEIRFSRYNLRYGVAFELLRGPALAPRRPESVE